MEKQQFIDKYSIGDSKPTDPTAKLVYASEFAASVEEFISDRFCAAAQVECDVKTHGRVLISDEYAAHLLKTVLTSVFGRAYLYISIKEQNRKISFSITSCEPLPLSKKETDLIIKTARNAGLKVESVDGGIFASLEFVDENQFSVYARSIIDNRTAILKTMEKIFFG